MKGYSHMLPVKKGEVEETKRKSREWAVTVIEKKGTSERIRKEREVEEEKIKAGQALSHNGA